MILSSDMEILMSWVGTNDPLRKVIQDVWDKRTLLRPASAPGGELLRGYYGRPIDTANLLIGAK